MIVIIGIMLGAYIIVRMMDLIVRRLEEKKSHAIIMGLATVVIFVAIVGIILLVSAPPSIRNLGLPR